MLHSPNAAYIQDLVIFCPAGHQTPYLAQAAPQQPYVAQVHPAFQKPAEQLQAGGPAQPSQVCTPLPVTQLHDFLTLQK